ncbi:hypothetical protein VCHA56P521_20261 [Vibrio chagasii]|nr:hypothetical protein VCHA36P168_30204 [Vibrio chagasii]CAH7040343.1 hypothetical protein VCHA43P282_190039 [Vibrio chagasii]CAH7278606.1 hypothetical protein VCHA52P461_30204 [Vibrio chagasii]CAH7369458.1 hypothetical protein VCHA37P203_20206 [Vibrio chagasii]CAH7389524.1 hypothetical protein VCHA56P521_20261 [Vibrio chagasii]
MRLRLFLNAMRKHAFSQFSEREMPVQKQSKGNMQLDFYHSLGQ